MSEEAEEPQPRATPHLFTVLRKLAFAAVALFVLWTVIGGKNLARTYPHPAPTAEQSTAKGTVTTAAPDDMTRLNDRVDHLEAWIKAHENDGTGVTGADKEHIAQLETQIEAQDKSIHALEQKLNDVKEQTARQLSSHLEKATTFDILKETLLRGEPFAAPLNQLRPQLVDNAKATALLAQLTPLSERGAPTPASLQNRFGPLVPPALAANDASNPLMRNVRSLILIRKVGEKQQGNNDEAIVARAEAKMDRADIDGAIKELTALSPPAAAVFAPWVGDAKNSLHARQLVDELQLAIASDTAKPAPDATPAASAQ